MGALEINGLTIPDEILWGHTGWTVGRKSARAAGAPIGNLVTGGPPTARGFRPGAKAPRGDRAVLVML